jgi:GNAT superfamily N-acetyltransferase
MPPKTLDRPATIRLARPEDLPEVHRMMIALAATHGEAATITPRVLERIALQGRAARLIVAMLPDSPQRHPVGYALVILSRNMVANAEWGFVEQLYVQEPDRKSGIGRALLAAARAEAVKAGCAGLTISTRPESDSAVLAYRATATFDPPSEPRFAAE